MIQTKTRCYYEVTVEYRPKDHDDIILIDNQLDNAMDQEADDCSLDWTGVRDVSWQFETRPLALEGLGRMMMFDVENRDVKLVSIQMTHMHWNDVWMGPDNFVASQFMLDYLMYPKEDCKEV